MKNARLFVLITIGLFCNISAMELSNMPSDILRFANRTYILQISPQYMHYAEAIKQEKLKDLENIDKNIQGEMRLEAPDGSFLIHEDKVYYSVSEYMPQFDCIPKVKCSVFFKKLLMLSAMAGSTKSFEYLMTRFYMPFPSLDTPVPEYDFLNKWLGRCAGFGGDLKMFEILQSKGLVNPKNISDIWIGAAGGDNIKILQWLFARYEFPTEGAQEIFGKLTHYSSSINKGFARDVLSKMDLKKFRYHVFGQSPLHLSIFYTNNVITETLLKMKDKIDINAQDSGGETPLFYAIRDWNTLWMTKLIDAGAHVDAKNEVGGTPLGIAALIGNVSAISLLLSRGANPYIANDFGRLPIEIALEISGKIKAPDNERYQESIKLLQSAMRRSVFKK